MNAPLVIAEIGCNHNGNLSVAKALVRHAHQAGADAVKFQVRSPFILTARARAARYDTPFGKTYGEHRAALEFSPAQYRELKELAAGLGITIFASAWDENSADFCAELGPMIKIASADLTNERLLRHCMAMERHLVVSTGMSGLTEITAVARMLEAWSRDRAGRRYTLLHCTSAYPVSDHDLRLLNMAHLMTMVCGVPGADVGYSCHAAGIIPALIAASMGASMIEKHFTLSRSQPGGDHKASLEPGELAELVTQLRRLPELLAAARFGRLASEAAAHAKLAKCLRAARALPAGHMLAAEDVVLRSPFEEGGMSGLEERAALGRRLLVPLSYEDAILRNAIG